MTQSSGNGARQDKAAVILGAGSTGLGAGLGLVLNGYKDSVAVIEKQPVPGGLAGSFNWNGHIVDYGPHRLSPNIQAVRVLANELLGPDLLIKRSQHGVQINGKCYQFPPRVIDWLSPPSVFYLLSLGVSFFWSKLLWITRRFSGDTFESIMARKFGRKFYESIVRPMAGKVWISPDKIDPSFAIQRFLQIHPFEVVKKILFPKQELNPSLFYYPRKGYQQLWDRMSGYLEREGRATLTYESRPTRIVIENKRVVRVHVETPKGEQVFSAQDLSVISTIPIASLLKILEGCPEQAELDELAKSVKVNSMILAAFEFDQPRTLPYRTLIFPQSDISFNRLFEQNEYSRDTVQPGKSVVVADITLPRGDARMNRPDAEILEQVKKDLSKLGYIPMDKISAEHVRRVEFAYVVPDIESRKAMYRMLHILKNISNLHVMGRFGAGEYDNSDYAIEDGLTLGAMISGKLSRMEFLMQSNAQRRRSIVG